MKFKRKKAKEQRGKPRPKYTPPQRTPEQEQEIHEKAVKLRKMTDQQLVQAFENAKRGIDVFDNNNKS